MRMQWRSPKAGQAVVMVGIGLIAMSGLMGLAVDLGWAFFVQRMEQAAGDAAAMAAVNNALDMLAGGATFDCTGLACGAGCSTSNCASAVAYATNNGFTNGGDSGRQQVLVDAGIPSPSPGAVPNGWAPGVNVRYWVTVRISDTIPQLFSAVFGNSSGTAAARSTAAIVDAVVNGSLILTNQGNVAGPCPTNKKLVAGCDLSQTGNKVSITAGGPVIVASNNSPFGNSNHVNISPEVVAITGTDVSPYPTTSTQFMPDGPTFSDPMAGKGQPPLPSSMLTPISVPGGTLDCSKGCGPGLYYASSTSASQCPNNMNFCATGRPIVVANGSFANGGSWGDYIFFGGLNVTAGTVTLGPGRYIMAGADPNFAPVDDNGNPASLYVAGGATLTGSSTTDAGRLIVLTTAASSEPAYPGLSTQLGQLTAYAPPNNVGWGSMWVDNSGSAATINLYGLDRTQTLPSGQNAYGYSLSDFAPAVIWQDQQDSSVKYNANGTICSSGCTANAGTVNPGIYMKHPNVTLSGMLYQPEGSTLDLHFGVNSWSPGNGLQMITGNLVLGGDGVINLGNPATTSPPLRRTATLVN